MAHIGKPGPVLFRRDFNLNVQNNNDGWFRRHYLTFTGLPPGSANILNGRRLEVGPDTYPSNTAADWIGQFTPEPIFQFKSHLIVQINDGKNYFKGVELIQKGAGIILVCHLALPDQLKTPRWRADEPWHLDFYNPDWFDSEPNNFRIEQQPKRWTDPPPH